MLNFKTHTIMKNVATQVPRFFLDHYIKHNEKRYVDPQVIEDLISLASSLPQVSKINMAFDLPENLYEYLELNAQKITIFQSISNRSEFVQIRNIIINSISEDEVMGRNFGWKNYGETFEILNNVCGWQYEKEELFIHFGEADLNKLSDEGKKNLKIIKLKNHKHEIKIPIGMVMKIDFESVF